MSPGRWPVSLRVADGLTPSLVLRPLHRRDQSAWEALRRDNTAYLSRWEPTPPDGTIVRTGFGGYVRSLNRDARAGNIAPFAVEVDGELAGQVHLFGVMRGSLLSGAAGYWLGERFAGHPARERRVVGRRRAPEVPRGGGARALPAHRGRLARSPDLRADGR